MTRRSEGGRPRTTRRVSALHARRMADMGAGHALVTPSVRLEPFALLTNPPHHRQAMARCHRIGQDKEVTIYRLITKVRLDAAERLHTPIPVACCAC